LRAAIDAGWLTNSQAEAREISLWFIGAHCNDLATNRRPRIAAQRAWRDGRNLCTRVATLSDSGHRVSLVDSKPGAHTVDYGHSKGEEIFVLSGELRDGGERYPGLSATLA